MAYTKRRNKGAGTVYKRGKFYYLEYTVNGQKKKTSLKTTKRKEAEEKAKELVPLLQASTKEQIAVHIAEAKKLRRQSGLLCENIWNEYIKQPNRPDSSENTVKWYKKIFDKFIDWIGKKHPEVKLASQVDNSVANEYFNYLWSRKISTRTYNAYLQTIKLVFNTIKESAALDGNPFEKIGKKIEEKESRKEFTKEQVKSIFEAFDNPEFYLLHKEQMNVMFNICCWTGARGQDACLMRWENVNFENNLISYIPEKTRRKTSSRSVSVPMHPQLRQALIEASEWRRDEYIIPDVAERYKTNPWGISKDSIKVFQFIGLQTATDKVKTRRKLKASQYSMHSFRHTFVSFCANSGVPLAIVQSIVGHGSPAMTRHYAHISQEAAKKAVDSLPIIGSGNKVFEKREQLKKLIDMIPEEKLEKAAEMLKSTLTDYTKKIALAVDEDLNSEAIESEI